MASCKSRISTGGTGRSRPRRAALHLRHHRPSERRDAHTRKFSAQHRELCPGARRARRRPRGGGAAAIPQFHVHRRLVVAVPSGCGIVLIKTLHPSKACSKKFARIAARFCRPCRRFTAQCWPCRSSANCRCACASAAARLCRWRYSTSSRAISVSVARGYGPTESSPVATVNPIYGENRPGSIGKPIPNVELSIRDESGGELRRARPAKFASTAAT